MDEAVAAAYLAIETDPDPKTHGAPAEAAHHPPSRITGRLRPLESLCEGVGQGRGHPLAGRGGGEGVRRGDLRAIARAFGVQGGPAREPSSLQVVRGSLRYKEDAPEEDARGRRSGW